MSGVKFSERMGEMVRRLLSCCDREDDTTPPLRISAPMNFRREDVSIPGLSEMQQTAIREIARQDAKQMYDDLQPLRSSPSETFTDRPTLPSYNDLTTTTQPAAIEGSPVLSVGRDGRRLSRETRLDRVKAHSRKISDVLTKPLSFGFEHEDSKHELRALMGYDAYGSASPRKGSVESFSVAGSEEEKCFKTRF